MFLHKNNKMETARRQKFLKFTCTRGCMSSMVKTVPSVAETVPSVDELCCTRGFLRFYANWWKVGARLRNRSHVKL